MLQESYQWDSTSCQTYGIKNSSGWLSCSYVKRSWVNICQKKIQPQKSKTIIHLMIFPHRKQITNHKSIFHLTFIPSPLQERQLTVMTWSTSLTDQSPFSLWASIWLLKKSNTCKYLIDTFFKHLRNMIYYTKTFFIYVTKDITKLAPSRVTRFQKGGWFL